MSNDKTDAVFRHYEVPLAKYKDAVAIRERMRAGEITAKQAEDQMNILLYGYTAPEELVDIVHKIQRYKEPPFREDDLYYNRYPWPKFGGISSGICMVWFWFRDDVIIYKKQVTMEDAKAALAELEESERK